MIDPQVRPKAYLRLMALVILLGLISALVTFVFMVLVHQGTSLLWTEAAQALGITYACVYHAGLHPRWFVGGAAGEVLWRSQRDLL